MKAVLRIGLCVFITGCLLSSVGCKKKTEPQTPSVPAQTTKPQAPPAPAQVTKPQTPPVPAQTTGSQLKDAALAAIPLDDVKAEIAKLNVEQLKAKAIEYKNAIVTKKAELAAATAKLKEIPVTQLMSTDAKTLQSNIDTLTKTVSDLTARLQLYNNKIKELGGSIIE